VGLGAGSQNFVLCDHITILKFYFCILFKHFSSLYARVVCATSHSGSVVDQCEHEFCVGITKDTTR
jgi:hypothetical protein